MSITEPWAVPATGIFALPSDSFSPSSRPKIDNERDHEKSTIRKESCAMDKE
jgi:hypothetical protein